MEKIGHVPTVVIEQQTGEAYYRNLIPLGQHITVGGIKVSPTGQISGEGFYLKNYENVQINGDVIPPGELCSTGPLTVIVEPVPHRKTKQYTDKVSITTP